MKKTIISVALAVIMLLSCAASAFAAVGNNNALQFDENGKFTIINLCDVQDGYPLNKTAAQFINEVIVKYSPDLVVLGGDNTVSSADTKAAAIKELCDLFVNNNTYFTLVFGNHDAQQGVEREELLEMYRLYGGEYCLAYDADVALTGVGTHNLTVLSSDGTKAAYNLYMFDSNMYVYDEEGNELGYDCVHTDQIEWYKATSAALKESNGGETVPALAFQHIIVQDIYDELFYESAVPMGELFRSYDGVTYSFLPKPWNIETGILLEYPCPGYYNLGQLDAMVETGDVQAIFSGHDHTNSFTVDCKGIKVINTPGCTFGSYGKIVNRGCRVIELDEATSTFTTECVSIADMALIEGSHITEFGDISESLAWYAKLMNKLCNVIVKIFNIFNLF